MASKALPWVGFVVLAIAFAGGKYVVEEYIWPWWERTTLSESKAEEILVSSQPDFYLFLKQKFPEDYQALLRDLTALMREGGDNDSLLRAGTERVAQLRRKHAHLVKQGRAEDLRALLTRTVELQETVLQREGVQLCNQVAMVGTAALIGRADVSSYNVQFSDLGLLFLKVIAGATESPQTYREPTDEDWAKIGQAMTAAGGTDAEFTALANSDTTSPDFCPAIIRMTRTVLGMEIEVGDPIVASLLAESAMG